MSSHDRNDTFKYVDFSIHHLDIWIIHLFSSSVILLKPTVIDWCFRSPVSVQALPLFLFPRRECSIYSQHRPLHRPGCRPGQEAGRGPRRLGKRHPGCLQRMLSRQQTLAVRCSSSLLHSAALWWPPTSDQHTWTLIKHVGLIWTKTNTWK